MYVFFFAKSVKRADSMAVYRSLS